MPVSLNVAPQAAFGRTRAGRMDPRNRRKRKLKLRRRRRQRRKNAIKLNFDLILCSNTVRLSFSRWKRELSHMFSPCTDQEECVCACNMYIYVACTRIHSLESAIPAAHRIHACALCLVCVVCCVLYGGLYNNFLYCVLCSVRPPHLAFLWRFFVACVRPLRLYMSISQTIWPANALAHTHLL